MTLTKDLDAAILAYRADPTPENEARLLQAQKDHTRQFLMRNAKAYISRTT